MAAEKGSPEAVYESGVRAANGRASLLYFNYFKGSVQRGERCGDARSFEIRTKVRKFVWLLRIMMQKSGICSEKPNFSVEIT